jgi:ATP-dependent Clp protease protease subunit
MPEDYDRSVDSHLFRNRIIYLSGEITVGVADYVVSRLLVLDSIDPRAEIKLYITSHGGSCWAGLAIYDAIQLVEAPVSTFCVGPAFSMAAWLLAAGERGRRFATPNSRIMIHQGSAGIGGTTADIRIAAENLARSEAVMNAILARHAGRSVDEILRAVERDKWMSPEEAREFGLIDEIAPFCERKVGSGPARPRLDGAEDDDGAGVAVSAPAFPNRGNGRI